MLFRKNKRKYRIIYCTAKNLVDGEIYVVYAEDRDKFNALLEEIKERKYTVLEKSN